MTSKKLLIIVIALFLLVTLCPFLHNRLQGKTGKARNIILISLDAVRGDHLSCAGYKRNTTPHICNFFQEEGGVLFSYALSQSSWTPTSHASMMMSKDTLEFNLWPSQQTELFWIKEKHKMIAEILQKKGFATAAFTGGVNLHPVTNIDQGFEYYGKCSQDDFSQHFERSINRSLAWLDDHKEQKKFLFLHTYLTHGPYKENTESSHWGRLNIKSLKKLAFGEKVNVSDKVARQVLSKVYEKEDPQAVPFEAGKINITHEKTTYTVYVNRSLGQIIKAYDRGIMLADSMLNRFFNTLRRRSMVDNSIIVVFADHGEAFMEHGHLFHSKDVRKEELIIPLLIHLPHKSNLERVDKRVRLMDVVPTLLDYLGDKVPRNMTGKSLLPLSSIQSRPVWAKNTAAQKKVSYIQGSKFVYYNGSTFSFYNESEKFPALNPYRTVSEKTYDCSECKLILQRIREEWNLGRTEGKTESQINESQINEKKLKKKLRELGYSN